jgi:hypothetical protein
MHRPRVPPPKFSPLTISADVTGYNAVTQATAAGYDVTHPLNIVLTVNAGIFVGGNMTLGPFAAGSSVKLINHGKVYGAGGNGDGGAGGTAITLNSTPVLIDNTDGFIFGGGGGGGAGGSHTGTNACQGGGGGGGFGYPPGAGGAAVGGGNLGTSGAAGDRTTPAVGGLGGNGGHDSFFGNSGGDGGRGGGSATTGNTGGSATTGEGGSGGGPPGKAIATNGVTITWLGGFDGTHVQGVVG